MDMNVASLLAQINEIPLGLPDYIVMVAYMLGLIGIGLYYRKYANQDLEHYFLGGRQFRGWQTGTSYAVTCMNADVPLAYCGMTVITGVWICWWYISRFGLALMIGAVLFAVFWRRMKIFTSPEFYEQRFAGKAAITMRTWISMRSAFIAVVAWTGCGLLGLTKVAKAVLGWDPVITLAVVIPVIFIYVLLSGYVGVVVSDIVQTAILIVSSLVLMGMVWHEFGGPMGLKASLVKQFGSGVVSWHPPSSHEFLGVMGVMAWFIGTGIGYGGDIAPMGGAMEGQRVLSCRNARESSKMYVWTAVMLFLMLAVLTLPALGAMVKWPGLHNGEIADQELAYGMLLVEYLPPGLLGLALVALFASIMSTVDSNMNLGAQVFINDVYRRSIRRNASPKHYLRVGQVVMVVIMGLALLVAFKAQKLIDVSVFMLGLSAAEMTANWGQWWWWRFNGKARLAASFGGPAIFLMIRYLIYPTLIVPYYMQPANTPEWLMTAQTEYSQKISARLTDDQLATLTPELLANPNDQITGAIGEDLLAKLTPELIKLPASDIVDQLVHDMSFAKTTNCYIYIPILGAIGATFLLWIAVALLTKPDPEETLIEFYKSARPMGYWGPIAAKVGGAHKRQTKVLPGLCIAVLGTVMVTAGTVAFSCFYIAQWTVVSVAGGIAVVSGVLFKIGYSRFMNALHEESDIDDESDE
ncbi:MAG: hypothetical protein GY794_19730 [bacterium]|nr:hypothetical protein [bacterium]